MIIALIVWLFLLAGISFLNTFIHLLSDDRGHLALAFVSIVVCVIHGGFAIALINQ